MPAADSVLAMLRSMAKDRGADECLRMGGVSYTSTEVLDHVEAVARGLVSLGLDPGDRVGIMCDNRPESLFSWLGANAASTIDVPFNVEARGRQLDYFVADASPRVLIGTADYLEVLAHDVSHDPEYVVCIGEVTGRPFGDRAVQLDFADLVHRGEQSAAPLALPRRDATATIMYTSGTTGPSKGVMLPQGYYPAQGSNAAESMGLENGEVILCVQPLFHIDARTFLSASWAVRGVSVMGRRFSASGFWDEVRAENVTAFATIGTMLWMLYKQPPTPHDRDLPAKLAICSSTPREILRAFEDRFGVRIIEAYGMTECVLITTAPAEETQPGRIGRAIDQLDVQLVDDGDHPVPVGDVGELVYRPREPFTMMQGYWAKPEATVETWRNLWFHTGDLVRQHTDGFLEYIGRKKDSIRRRGENVSAWEVEEAITAHPSVLEAAAIGVPSAVGEEDVAVLVVPVNGHQIDPAELASFVARDLPRFAVPRYIEIVPSLPKTPSERIEKGKVRERGITAAAWDADAAGRPG